MKQINIVVTVSLVLLSAFGASAQIDIKAADGADLAGSTYIGDTFTVQIMEDGTPVGAGTVVVFVLTSTTNIGCNPIYATTDSDGRVKYKPLVNGMLSVRVLDGTNTVAEIDVTVEDEPWVPVPTPTKKSSADRGRSASSGGGGMVLPDSTPTQTTPQTVVDDAPVQVDTQTIPVVDQEAIDVIDSKPVRPEPKATPSESSIPGFGAIFATAGILGGAYAYYQRMR